MYPLLHDQENGSSRPKLIGGLEKNVQHFAYRQRNRDTHISDKSSGWHWGTPKIFSAVTKQSMYRQKNQMLTEIEPVVRCA